MSEARKWVRWIQYGTLAVFVGGLAVGYVRGDGLGGALAVAEALMLGLVLAAVAVVVVGLGWSVLGGDGNRLDDRVTGPVELALRAPRRGTVFAILGLLLLAAIVGAWFLLADTGRRALGPVGGWEPAALGLAIVFVAIWAVLMLGMLKRLVRNAPWFVLGARGFLYAPGDIAPGFVRWEDVTGLRETEIVANSRRGRGKATAVLAVGLRDPERYQARYNPVLRALVRLGAKLHAAQSGGAADIVIDPTHFGGDYPKVLERMRALHAQATGRGDGA